MLPNDFHKRLIEESQKQATISEEMRYGVHFEYNDLVRRLTKLKTEKEKTIPISISQNKIIKQPKINLLRTSHFVHNFGILNKDSSSPLRDLSTSRLHLKAAQSKSPIRAKLGSTIKPLSKILNEKHIDLSPMRFNSSIRLRTKKSKIL
ncbi:unnamed protein product [Blepharisma stoltei]|uniref:Uncharacterized protein n=1 Tax=Blepharisma stoltei TaxID=1481888 RepID=A0AAU9IFA4_9CILI|nr:unnamed protein product [Blepharisma stoltei]